MVSMGDLVLDVIVDGALDESRDAGESFRLTPGGSAANFAVHAVRDGGRIRFISRVGDDAAGRLLIAELARAGVITSVDTHPTVATGNVLVLRNVGRRGQERMISNPGASRYLDPAALDPIWFVGIDALHISGYSLLRSEPSPAAERAYDLARAHSPQALISLDPGPKHLIEAYGRARLWERLGSRRFAVLFPNLEEGVALTGERDPLKAARALAAVANLVVLTLGAEGCLVVSDRIAERVAAERADAVDTTGAGDAFAAAFLVDYVRGRDPIRAARAGARAAARVVERIGAW
jgi:ribokinase